LYKTRVKKIKIKISKYYYCLDIVFSVLTTIFFFFFAATAILIAFEYCSSTCVLFNLINKIESKYILFLFQNFVEQIQKLKYNKQNRIDKIE